MSASFRVGELFMLGFRGLEIPGWLREFERRFGLGGVILFDYNCQTRTYENNIQSPAQVKDLCAQISTLSSRPLVFIDQEGGKVRRLKEKLGFAPLPSALNFNRLPIDERRALALASFRELRELGIHFNLAPVIDLNLNPKNPDIGAVERSYSDDPDEVRRNIEIVDAAAREAGLGLSLKHFPGLGGATVNSHEELTDLSDSVSQAQLELFYEWGERISGQSMIVSHGIVKQWDPELPVSMSREGIRRIRERLPDVLLISDDLQMQGLQKKVSSKEACVLGLEAGLDLLAIGNNLMAEDDAALEWAENLKRAAGSSPALAQAISASLGRVARRKNR